MAYISAADYMCLCLLLFTQLSLNVEPSESITATYGNRVLHEIDTQGHSFCRTTRGSTSPCNIAGLISEVSKEVATQIAKNCSRQPPHSNLRSPPRGTPESIRIYLIFPETRVIGLHFCRRCMYGSIFIQICAVCSKRSIFSAPESGLAVQGCFMVIQGR